MSRKLRTGDRVVTSLREGKFPPGILDAGEEIGEMVVEVLEGREEWFSDELGQLVDVGLLPEVGDFGSVDAAAADLATVAVRGVKRKIVAMIVAAYEENEEEDGSA